MSTSTTIRRLRADLATAVRRAGDGERLVVTVNGRALAQLGPLGETTGSLDQLIATGAVIAPRRRGAMRRRSPVPIWPGTRLDRVVAEVRG